MAPITTKLITTQAPTTTPKPVITTVTTKLSTAAISTTTNLINSILLCNGRIGFFAHPTNCQFYLSCTSASQLLAMIGTCNAGLYFNPVIGACDW